jgi:hypothetical protein
MQLRNTLALALTAALGAGCAGSHRVEKVTARTFDHDDDDREVVYVVPADDAIYGRVLMTDDDLVVYRRAVVVPMTRSERIRLEREHRARMDERARVRRVVIVDDGYDERLILTEKTLPPGNGGARGPGTSTGARRR